MTYGAFALRVSHDCLLSFLGGSYSPVTCPVLDNDTAISVVAAGFGGDMPEELADILIDDIDYHYNKVKCRQIELIIPS